MKKATGTIDREIGTRMRTRRMLIGMSQEKLGEELGLTFQQVQKYEKGTNRISVGRMVEIAKVPSRRSRPSSPTSSPPRTAISSCGPSRGSRTRSTGARSCSSPTTSPKRRSLVRNEEAGLRSK